MPKKKERKPLTKGEVRTLRTVHYHHDTKQIDSELTRGTIYDTTRGTGEYQGRSHSNGKLLFIGVNDQKNIYFTKKQWESEGNSTKRVNKKLMEASVEEMMKPIQKAVKGLVAGKTALIHARNGRPYLFLGIHHEYGIHVQEQVASKAKEYYTIDMFRDLFIIDGNEADAA